MPLLAVVTGLLLATPEAAGRQGGRGGAVAAVGGAAASELQDRRGRGAEAPPVSVAEVLQGKGEEEERTLGPDGCLADEKCCAPARYTARDEVGQNFPLEAFEPACVRNSDIQSACRKVHHLGTVWVKAGKAGQVCRGRGAPTLKKVNKAWEWDSAFSDWQPGDVPPGGVGLQYGWPHWWPSLGAPCDRESPYEAQALQINEKRGCWLFDVYEKRPMWRLASSPEVHWSGSEPIPELMYGNVWDTHTESRPYPFPAWCAKATVSILSTVYRPGYTEPSLLAAVKVLTTSFHYSHEKCRSVSFNQYDKAIRQMGKKSCWNFSNDFVTVLCYKFWRCRCNEKGCDDTNVGCCRSGFASFLKEENLTNDYLAIAKNYFDRYFDETSSPEPLQALLD